MVYHCNYPSPPDFAVPHGMVRCYCCGEVFPEPECGKGWLPPQEEDDVLPVSHEICPVCGDDDLALIDPAGCEPDELRRYYGDVIDDAAMDRLLADVLGYSESEAA